MQLEEYIMIVPRVRGGKPCIKGTHITMYDVLEYMASGMSEAETPTTAGVGVSSDSRTESEGRQRGAPIV